MKISFCLIFIFFPAVILAADVFPGSTIYASNSENSWDSPNKTFSLSFIRVSENTYFAAMIYNGIPVWKAGGDPGGAVNSSAALHFVSDGNLQLIYTSTACDVFLSLQGFLVWQSNTAGRGISTGTLDDSGNFILRNGSIQIWTTFDNPTDTILPGQNFTVNHVLRSGLYSFRLLSSGNMTLQWNDSIVYYSSSDINGSLVNTHLTSPSLGLQQPLESDGNLRIYSSAGISGSGNKIVRWTAVSDQCQVFGYCGNMEICSYNDDFSPMCGCPSENFDPTDPNDLRKGLSTWDSLSESASALPVRFSYKELQHATNGFKEKLGEGGFGAIYRGVLRNKTVVAVKQLEGIEQGEKQFGMEVAKISSTHHLYLVRLLGFCNEGRHRLLRHRTILSARGTRGYLPPELLANLPINIKADVYSYGMMLLEMISGRRNFEVSTETNHKKLPLWAYEEFEKFLIKGFLDTRST
ncbi:G-type lectin S-receptor-like serine threonine-kinase At1g34300 [Olea europaea subsp. europaea]|uniref:non-specific serine/threonine protein kinase n=1 Tax=Olea europaea subsp. europaea TaxID=158383 RepID=A0A8S0U208_OLEEU|nr:G-type lectin S-receptor-like serine threonine-kinase At1g34300 [Olea europaea subsp. europaea]